MRIPQGIVMNSQKTSGGGRKIFASQLFSCTCNLHLKKTANEQNMKKTLSTR